MRGKPRRYSRVRSTGMQILMLTAIGLLDTARREFRDDEFEVFLDFLAARIAREYVKQGLLADRREAA